MRIKEKQEVSVVKEIETDVFCDECKKNIGAPSKTNSGVKRFFSVTKRERCYPDVFTNYYDFCSTECLMKDFVNSQNKDLTDYDIEIEYAD